ncbi:uncharacterized protein TNCV_1344381 [Trichonephila clavipes]|nr:uncharacterized protein TNCV_1344381 [Trichonephila clavipes]
MSSSLIPLMTRRVGERCTLNLSKLKRHPVGVEKGVPSHVSPSSLDQGSKFRVETFNLPSPKAMAAVAEWYRCRIVACLVTGSSPVPLKTHRVEQRCTLNLSRAETSSRWCGVVVRRGGASSGVVHVT